MEIILKISSNQDSWCQKLVRLFGLFDTKIKYYFLNHEYKDILINYMHYKIIKSFYYLKDLGCYYIFNPNSSIIGYKKMKNALLFKN